MKSKVLGALMMSLVLWSCEQGNKKVTTESGIEVEFLNDNPDSRTAKHGEIVLFNMRYTTDTDSVLFDTDEQGGAVPISYDTAQWRRAGQLYEAFELCSEGDSITFELSARDLFSQVFRRAIPKGVNPESNIRFNVGLEKVRTTREYEDELIAAAEGLIEKEGQLIDKYLEENGLEAITTESGLRYVITEEGSGENAAPGQNVEVHYHGTLLDGTKFDSSFDRNQPFTFVLGRGGVIRGWDEGFALLNKGTKATLLIPSPLAYGNQARGPIIKANSILKFDVELLDIK